MKQIKLICLWTMLVMACSQMNAQQLTQKYNSFYERRYCSRKMQKTGYFIVTGHNAIFS